VPFELHRTLEVDRRLLAATAGTYKRRGGELRSIEDCTGELGWQQLIYVDRSGGRKALFARPENSFSFGPGYLIPEPSEGTLTFLGVS
jgi:hypothetical protein